MFDIFFRKSRAFIALFATLLLLLAASCEKSEPESKPEPNPHRETSILLYAVASNNLNYNFKDDLDEIRTAAANINLNEAEIMVYSVTNSGNPTLTRLVKNEDDSFGFKVLKEYDRDAFSTDPERIHNVIWDYLNLSDATKRGLILWSHATGWTPDFDDHIVPEIESTSTSAKAPQSVAVKSMASVINYSFGSDHYGNVYDHCDLIELANAIPDNKFDFIWFDCCYMSQIEVFYQLRNKARYFIASPNELAAEGMPYDLTMPLVARKNYSLYQAVKAESEYFVNKNVVYAMALVDATALEEVATAAEKVVKNRRPSTLGLQKYNTPSFGPFFDFGQYIRNWGNVDENWDSSEFDAAMDKLVIFKSASAENWDRNPIRPENFSGIGTHFFYDDETDEAEYYKNLSWFTRLYTTIPE